MLPENGFPVHGDNQKHSDDRQQDTVRNLGDQDQVHWLQTERRNDCSDGKDGQGDSPELLSAISHTGDLTNSVGRRDWGCHRR